MKVTKENIIDRDNMVGHIVLHCLCKYPKILSRIAEKGECDVKFTVDDQEIEIESFVNHWQKQINRMIEKKAQEINREKFMELEDLIQGVKGRLEEKRWLPDPWE